MFSGRVQEGHLYIGEDRIIDVKGVPDQEVVAGIRPEGFVLSDGGPLTCAPVNVEVMGRDVSVVSTHPASLNPLVRSIINADNRIELGDSPVRYAIKPRKLFIFKKETGERINFEVK